MTTQAFNRINALTQEQRDKAYDAARNRIAGAKPAAAQEPTLQQFIAQTETHFPQWVTMLVRALTVFTLVIVFLPSAMRLHAVALETNRAIASIAPDAASVYIAALATVVMAEIGQTIMSLASAVTQNRAQKAALWFGALTCTAIAISGNAIAMGSYATQDIFAFLETYAPPVLVLILAQIIKTQMLDAIARRYNAAQHYNAAITEWQTANRSAAIAWSNAFNSAHQSQEWETVLANTLRDALRSANRSSKAVLRDLTPVDWRALVVRERNAGEWWQRAEALALEQAQQEAEQEARLQALEQKQAARAAAAQVINAAPATQTGKTWTKACPECGRKFTGTTKRQATNRLAAHRKAHRNAERDATEQDTKPVEPATIS